MSGLEKLFVCFLLGLLPIGGVTLLIAFLKGKFLLGIGLSLVGTVLGGLMLKN